MEHNIINSYRYQTSHRLNNWAVEPGCSLPSYRTGSAACGQVSRIRRDPSSSTCQASLHCRCTTPEHLLSLAHSACGSVGRGGRSHAACHNIIMIVPTRAHTVPSTRAIILGRHTVIIYHSWRQPVVGFKCVLFLTAYEYV